MIKFKKGLSLIEKRRLNTQENRLTKLREKFEKTIKELESIKRSGPPAALPATKFEEKMEENKTNSTIISPPTNPEEPFIFQEHRRKYIKRRAASPPQEEQLVGITLKNSYSVIAPVEMESEDLQHQKSQSNDDMEEDEPRQEPRESTAPRRKRQPPIVISGEVTNQRSLVERIKLITSDFKLDVSKANGTFTITTFHPTDFQAIKAQYQNYYTFTAKDDRCPTFTLRGLDETWNVDEVKLALQEEGVKVTKINAMRQSPALKDYTLVFSASKGTSLVQLRKITYLLHKTVHFDMYRNSRGTAQCHRCQLWGHIAANCTLGFRCLKCGDKHRTDMCTKPREEPARCANCDGPHPANSTECPAYKDRMDFLANRRAAHQHQEPARPVPQRTTHRTFAPAPATNPWTTRRAQTERQSECAGTTLGETGKLNRLENAFKRINSLCDIDDMIAKAESLANLLQGATRKSEQFEIIRNFYASLDN